MRLFAFTIVLLVTSSSTPGEIVVSSSNHIPSTAVMKGTAARHHRLVSGLNSGTLFASTFQGQSTAESRSMIPDTGGWNIASIELATYAKPGHLKLPEPANVWSNDPSEGGVFSWFCSS